MVVLYVIAVFYTSLTMLNMLIAIMGDTFGNVMESRNLNAIRTKLDILSDMAPVLSKEDAKDMDEVFMIVVTPQDSGDFDDENWQGSINQLSNIVTKNVLSLEKKMNRKIDHQQLSVQREITQQVGSVNNKCDQIKTDVGSIKTTVVSEVADLKKLLKKVLKS